MTKTANKTGRTLESTVKAVMSSKGFQILSYKEWHKDPGQHSTDVLLTNAPFTTIYNHPGHTEFLLISKRLNIEIRIECKWQQSPGSVDEKLPYLYLNCVEKMPEKSIVILIDGEGFKKGAIQWLKDAVANKKYSLMDKEIKVMNLREFMEWANNTL